MKLILTIPVLILSDINYNVICAEEKLSGDKIHHTNSIDLLIFVALLILTVLTIWIFKRFNLKFIHETSLSIIYGLLVGLILKLSIPNLPVPIYSNFTTTSLYNNNHAAELESSPGESSESQLARKATFDPEIFFSIILPPIIFNAGYSMKRKQFFKNFGAILSYAFVGTLISSLCFGGLMYGFTQAIHRHWRFNDCLLFGIILSATAPAIIMPMNSEIVINKDLYIMLFGDSILNNAVAIVLYRVLDIYGDYTFNFIIVLKCTGIFFGVFFGAFLIGCLMGCLTALLTKFTEIRNHPLLETSLLCTMSYCTFVAAETANMPGIVSLLFCGICQAHYTFNNLSEESKLTTKQVFELMSFLLDNFVFVYIGISTFVFASHLWDPAIIALAFLSIIISRVVAIYPLSAIINLRRIKKISLNYQNFIMLNGIRGSVAFALAIQQTKNEILRTIFTTTLVIVMITVIFCGAILHHAIRFLKISDENFLNNNLEMQSINNQMDPVLSNISIIESTDFRAKNKVARIWSNFDKLFLKPLLTHSMPSLMTTLPKSCTPFSKIFTSKLQVNGDDRMLIDHDYLSNTFNEGAENVQLDESNTNNVATISEDDQSLLHLGSSSSSSEEFTGQLTLKEPDSNNISDPFLVM